jgi:molybdate transport system substrate-binding protein
MLLANMCVAFGCPAQDDRILIRIAAAADLRYALPEWIEFYQKSHPKIKIEPTFGASGMLMTQITQGAPFDLYLSADMQYPIQLVLQGRAYEESVFPLVVGHLVLWTRNDRKLDLEKAQMNVLLDPSVKKISMANPKHAPYGRAADSALINLQLADKIDAKLVLGENAAQATQFVESGAVDVGLIPLSLAMSPALQSQGNYIRIPAASYTPILQGGVILKQTKHRTEVEAFVQELRGEAGQAHLKKYGFDTPDESISSAPVAISVTPAAIAPVTNQ